MLIHLYDGLTAVEHAHVTLHQTTILW